MKQQSLFKSKAQELSSGMRKLVLDGKAYSVLDPTVFPRDIFHTVISIPVFREVTGELELIASAPHWQWHVTPQVTPHVTPQVTPQVIDLLAAIALSAKTRQELRSSTGIKDREHFRKAYLEPLLAAGWIERTIPDKPTSRFQKYLLTERGRDVLQHSRSRDPGR